MEDKWKINLKKITCPNCKNEINYFRMPRNLRQALWGGYTCDNCGCELNKFGEIIKKKK